MNEEINFFEMINTIKRYKKLVLIMFCTILILGISITFLMKPSYQAITSFFFPFNAQGGGKLSKLLGGGTSSGADILGMLGLDSPVTMADYVKPILESRTVSDHILDKYGPQLFEKKFKKMKRATLYKKLKSIVKIEKSRENNTILIKVVTDNPKLSADIANEYIEEYKKFSEDSALSFTKKKLKFSREQREQTRKKLEELEGKMKTYQETHEVIDVPEETKTLIKYYADTKTLYVGAEAVSAESDKMVDSLRKKFTQQTSESKQNLDYPINDTDPKLISYYTELTQLQMQLAHQKETLTDEHPEIKKLNNNISHLQEAIRKHISKRLEDVKSNLTPELIETESMALASRAKKDALKKIIDDLEKRMGKIPELGMEYGRLLRDVKAYNQIYLYWEMELQKSLAEESRDPSDFQILDKAVPPDHKFSPSILVNTAVTFLLACMLPLGTVFVLDAVEQQKNKYLLQKRQEEFEKKTA